MYVVDFHYFINSLFSIDSGYCTKQHILHAFIIEYQLQGGGGGKWFKMQRKGRKCDRLNQISNPKLKTDKIQPIALIVTTVVRMSVCEGGWGGWLKKRFIYCTVTYDTCFSKQHGKGDHFMGKRGCGCPVYIPISYLITLL